jgi:hypothetical protein
MEQRDIYSDVISRTLTRAERRTPNNEEGTPLVIEPLKSSSAAFLREFLKYHSSQILEDLAKHGALLVRGFEVESPADFERQLLSIRGMCGMDEVLLSEPGRVRVNGTRFVFHTNTLMKTGGAFEFPYFHTENYYVPDVPRYISFWCQTPGELGGETGLVNVTKVYADLPAVLQRKLEERTCLVSLNPVTEMVKRYAVSAEIINEFCEGAGLPVITIDGAQYLTIYKPSVVQHPLTEERALLVHSYPVPAIHKLLRKYFLTDYSDPQWLVHRLICKCPAWIMHVGEPRRLLRAISSERARKRLESRHATEAPLGSRDALPLSALFSPEESRILASAMRRRYFAFPWKSGDILILDNLKIAHGGMPGRGKRDLKVIMCNPVPLPYSSLSSGLHVIPHANDPKECLGAQLVRLRNSSSGLQ